MRMRGGPMLWGYEETRGGLTQSLPRSGRFLRRDSREPQEFVVVAVVLPLVKRVQEGLQGRGLSRSYRGENNKSDKCDFIPA